jgi:hypothetical protein
METTVERNIESLLYATGHHVWFVLETGALFGLMRKSRHDFAAAGAERFDRDMADWEHGLV